ncbi:MAG TPA: hypothetical protein VE131_07320, partial [Terriglobales bacterium]|nr:hypothetical protein [Terriglobales bacterium]
MALLLVLWIFIFLSAVAFEFSTAAREEATATHRFTDETEGYYLAVAGFERGVYDFLRQSSTQETALNAKPTDFFDGRWHEETLGGGVYRFRLSDESGKININRVEENTLRLILTNLGIEEPRRTVLVDSILDWRDPDDLHRASGAENEYYLGLTPPYTAKNGPFDALEDLLWVRGVTTDLYNGRSGNLEPVGESEPVGLRDIFTVESPTNRINLRTAPAEVIHALLGMPLQKAREFTDEREKLSEKSISDLLRLLGVEAGSAALQQFIFANPTVVTIEAEGQPESSSLSRRVKGVIRAGGGNRRVELLRWVDREIAL